MTIEALRSQFVTSRAGVVRFYFSVVVGKTFGSSTQTTHSVSTGLVSQHLSGLLGLVGFQRLAGFPWRPVSGPVSFGPFPLPLEPPLPPVPLHYSKSKLYFYYLLLLIARLDVVKRSFTCFIHSSFFYKQC